MKQNYLVAALLLISTLFVGVGCNNDDDVELGGGGDVSKEEKYPIEIPFKEYSLAGTVYQWKRFFPEEGYGHASIVINSKEELKTHLKDGDDIELLGLDINFSTHTLLLAYGVEGHVVHLNEKKLQQTSTKDYVMTVELLSFLHSTITYWHVPILVNKIADDSRVELIVTKK